MFEIQKRKSEYIWASWLAFFIVIYNFVWLNKAFPTTEGWSEFYSGLLKEGKIPYKDFYYYLPPLNLVIDGFIWKISGGYFLIYRILRLFERIVMFEAMYWLLVKQFQKDPFICSVFGCILSIFYSATIYDLIGDYNQTAQFLIMLVCVLFVLYYRNIHKAERFKYVFLIGIIGGLMFLQKQTVFLATLIVFCMFAITLFVTGKEKQVIRFFLLLISGGLLIILCTCIYLMKHGALDAFIAQVFLDTSSKGSLVDIVFVRLFKTFFHQKKGILAFFLFWIGYKLSFNVSFREKKTYFLFYFAGFFILGGLYSNNVFRVLTASARSGYLLISFFATCLVLLFLRKESDREVMLFAPFYFIMLFLPLVINYKDASKKIFRSCNTLEMLTGVLSLLFCMYAFIFVYLEYEALAQRKKFEFDKLVLVCAAIASGWTTIMANNSDGGVTPTCAVFIVGMLPVFVNQDNSGLLSKKTFRYLGVICLSFCVMAGLPQKVMEPYSWWGNSEASFWKKKYKTSIPALKGFRLSEEEKQKYELLYKVLATNTNAESVIWGFPYIKIFNVFLQNYNMKDFVPVLFYDVCSKQYAQYDASLLVKNEPDIVIWVDIPYCMSTHEKVFLGGDRLGQRDIQRWFSLYKNRHYHLIGQMDNIFIYKLNKLDDDGFVYIDDSSRINETAKFGSSAL